MGMNPGSMALEVILLTTKIGFLHYRWYYIFLYSQLLTSVKGTRSCSAVKRKYSTFKNLNCVLCTSCNASHGDTEKKTDSATKSSPQSSTRSR